MACSFPFLLWAFLVLPSLGVVARVGGLLATLGYAMVMGALAWMLPTRFYRGSGLNRGTGLALLALLFILLTTAFATLYPRLNTHTRATGSDRDDALDLATAALLHRHYPYTPRTYLGNPITPAPGALLLAAPFRALFGHAAWQNLFWLAVLAAFVARQCGAGSAAMLLLTLLLGSPEILRELLTGGDLPANSLYVMTAALLVVKHGGAKQAAARWLPPVFLGIALSSRFNMLFLLPLVAGGLVQRVGWRRACEPLALTLLVFCLVTLPFWIGHAGHFTPTWTIRKVRYAPRLIIAATTLGALSLGFLASNKSPSRLLLHAGCVLMIPQLFILAGASIQSGRIRLDDAGLGLLALFPGVTGAWMECAGKGTGARTKE